MAPLQEMQLQDRKYHAPFNHSDFRKSHQRLNTIPVFPTSTKSISSRPESRVETIYESSKAESHDELIVKYVLNMCKDSREIANTKAVVRLVP